MNENAQDTKQEEKDCGMFECFHCLHRSVIWQCDYTFEDFGYEGEGLVQILTCANCGAEIEYRISYNEEEDGCDGAGTDTQECGASAE